MLAFNGTNLAVVCQLDRIGTLLHARFDQLQWISSRRSGSVYQVHEAGDKSASREDKKSEVVLKEAKIDLFITTLHSLTYNFATAPIVR